MMSTPCCMSACTTSHQPGKAGSRARACCLLIAAPWQLRGVEDLVASIAMLLVGVWFGCSLDYDLGVLISKLRMLAHGELGRAGGICSPS
jgi:hypothetical protein